MALFVRSALVYRHVGICRVLYKPLFKVNENLMQFIITLFAGLLTLILLLSGERSRRSLLYIGLASIALGHRGVYLGKVTYFVPLEIIIILLFGILILDKLVVKDRDTKKIPGLLIFVTLWSLLVAVIALVRGISWDLIFDWTIPLVIGLPTFWVIRHFFTTEDHLSIMLKILLGASTVIAITGLFEYQFPAVANTLPGLFMGTYIPTAQGFLRASFSFWGYPAAAIIVTWGMLIAYNEILNPRRSVPILIYIGLFVICAAAVYVSGQRGSWYGLIIALIVLGFSKRIKGGIGTAAIFFATASFLPVVFWIRFDTITNYIQNGVVGDSSTASRLARWSWGWENMIHNPILGVGYGHWLVHNAFLEIGSTIGVIPAIAFLIFIILLIVRVVSVALHGPTSKARSYGWLFFAISITWIIQFNVEAIYQTVPLAIAFWPYMAVAWYLPDLFKANPDIIANESGRANI